MNEKFIQTLINRRLTTMEDEELLTIEQPSGNKFSIVVLRKPGEKSTIMLVAMYVVNKNKMNEEVICFFNTCKDLGYNAACMDTITIYTMLDKKEVAFEDLPNVFPFASLEYFLPPEE